MVPPPQLQPGCFWKLLSEAPVPASPAPHLNFVSKLCHWEVPRPAAAEAGRAGEGGEEKGTAFPGSSCKATIRKDIF